MTDTAHTPALDAGVDVFADRRKARVLDLAKQLDELARIAGLQTHFALADPNDEGGLEVTVISTASPGFRAALGRRLVEADDAAPFVDHQRVHDILSSLDAAPASGSVTGPATGPASPLKETLAQYHSDDFALSPARSNEEGE